MRFNQRVPGGFARSGIGHERPARFGTGWRRFLFGDPDCVIEDRADACVNTIVETSGNTVVTYLNVHSMDSQYPIDGRVGAIPLKTAEGQPIRFGDPFVLNVMIELLTISGDYEDGNDNSKTMPQLAMGIGMNASDFDSDSNRHLVYGWRCGAAGTQDIDEDGRWIVSHLATGGSGQFLSNQSAGDDVVLYTAQFMVGPDLTNGSGGAESFNATVARMEYKDSQHGTPYETGSSNLTAVSLNQNQGFNDPDAQVYLYAMASDKNDVTNDDGNPCVVTARFWYMVEADVLNGYGTS